MTKGSKTASGTKTSTTAKGGKNMSDDTKTTTPIETTDSETTDTKTVTTATSTPAPAPEGKDDDLTPEQVRAAAELAAEVTETENQGSIANIRQARALQTIRDQGLFKGIQKPGGGTYSSFNAYCADASKKSQPTISQNITVVASFGTYTDEEISKAGMEKLYIALQMKKDGIYSSIEECMSAALRLSRGDLQELRKSGKSGKASIVVLSKLEATKAQADRFDAIFSDRYKVIYSQVHGDSMPSDAQVVDFFLDVVGGLSTDFLLTAAAGEGGADPEMSDGFKPKDVTLRDALSYLARAAAEDGISPDVIVTEFEAQAQGIRDRAELVAKQREEKEKADEKIKKDAEKELAKWVSRIEKAEDKSVIMFADGAEAIVLGTEADGGNGVKRVMLEAQKDGSENVFPDKGEWFLIADIAAKSPVKIEKPKKEAAKKESKKAATDGGGTSLGISKSQSAGRTPKKGKKVEAQPEVNEGEGEEESPF